MNSGIEVHIISILGRLFLSFVRELLTVSITEDRFLTRFKNLFPDRTSGVILFRGRGRCLSTSPHSYDVNVWLPEFLTDKLISINHNRIQQKEAGKNYALCISGWSDSHHQAVKKLSPQPYALLSYAWLKDS